ncbi:MAG TPA: hypothetical protein VFG42_05835 [Baekduia sp.]|uniref:hypothetical protein n=1 Tax=Baekduia sp. TaxID=2600305 RepID=UPI002D790034|nr:hypothetical protein [Baekduia sp.]HET6506288.1 hypothetical protein [Baekduia sp.]
MTDVKGGEVVRLVQRTPGGANAMGPSKPAVVGTQWISSPEYDYHYYFDIYTNWRTGEVRRVNPTDGTVPDLDAASGAGRLCAPLKPVVSQDRVDWGGGPSTLPVTARGRWALIQDRADPEKPHFRLFRCGSAKAVALPAGFTQPVLGDGWLAQARGTRVDLLRLADRRAFRVSASSWPDTLHFTHDRLYLRSGRGTPWRTVQLPNH